MSTSKTEYSPRRYARAGGLAYLIIIVVGFIDEMFIRSKLIVHGEPAGTADNILAHPLQWRIGIAGLLLAE
jgi:Domain of unknown function (DUF4386)